jgi:hypothetical protein
MTKLPYTEMNTAIKAKFGIDKLVVSLTNYQVHFNRDLLDSLNADTKAINQFMVHYLMKKDYILNAFPTSEILTSPMPQYLREKIANGFLYNRSGDIQMVLKSGYIDGGATGTTHGLWYSYDAHIPLIMVWFWNQSKDALIEEFTCTILHQLLQAYSKFKNPAAILETQLKKY